MKTLLQGPLCYQTGGTSHGTLKSLSHWCAARRPDLRLHFAKTGTQVASDPNATVDAWISGGLQFSNGAAYSYVVVVGTGSTSQPWATGLHAAQIAAPLLEHLLADLASHCQRQSAPRFIASCRRRCCRPRARCRLPTPTVLAQAIRPAGERRNIGRTLTSGEIQQRALTPN